MTVGKGRRNERRRGGGGGRGVLGESAGVGRVVVVGETHTLEGDRPSGGGVCECVGGGGGLCLADTCLKS